MVSSWVYPDVSRLRRKPKEDFIRGISRGEVEKAKNGDSKELGSLYQFPRTSRRR